MTIIWHTKNINIQKYYTIIRNNVMFNSDDGKYMAGSKYWQEFKKTWTVHIIPVDQAGEYSQFYAHLLGREEKFSEGIAWGITGDHEIVLFIIDSRNPFIIRSNAMIIGHELLHAIYQDKVGTFHITRMYDAPDGNKGTKAPAATVIVHDTWYGSKCMIVFWIGWLIGYIPIKMPFIQVKTAKMLYPI